MTSKVSATPPTPLGSVGSTGPAVVSSGSSSYTTDIKIATSNLFLTDDTTIDPDIMADLIFENIGGEEIINIARSSTVNGQDVIYQPIKNVSMLAAQYSSKNILQSQNTSDTIFDNFSLKLENYVPVEPEFDPVDGVDAVYIEQYTGNIIINLINMNNDEQVEIQIVRSGTDFDDTIY